MDNGHVYAQTNDEKSNRSWAMSCIFYGCGYGGSSRVDAPIVEMGGGNTENCPLVQKTMAAAITPTVGSSPTNRTKYTLAGIILRFK